MDLTEAARRRLWQQVKESLEACITRVPEGRVTPDTSPERVRSVLESISFDTPLDPAEAVDFVVQGLLHHQVQVSHPASGSSIHPPLPWALLPLHWLLHSIPSLPPGITAHLP